MIDRRLAGTVIEVDEDIAAEDKIEIPHGTHRHTVMQVQMREFYQRRRLGPDSVAFRLLDKIFLQVFGRDVPHRTRSNTGRRAACASMFSSISVATISQFQYCIEEKLPAG